MADVLNLDEMLPGKNPVAFTDRAGQKHTFDVSFIPFEAGLLIIERLPKLQSLGSGETMEADDFKMIIELLSLVCIQEDASLTADFLKKNLSLQQAIALLQAAMKTIGDFVKSNGLGVVEVGKEGKFKK